MEINRPSGSKSQILASQHSSLSARHHSLELGDTNKPPGLRSLALANQRPPLRTRPRSLGELSQVSHTSSNVDLGNKYMSWARARAKDARLRSAFNASELEWRRAKQTYQRTRKQYENAINPSKTSVVALSPQLANLRELFELDRAFLEEKAIEVTRRKQELEEVQNNLQHNETMFMVAARRTLQPDPYLIQPSIIGFSDAQTLHHNASGPLPLPSSQLDGRLTDLYDKEAEVKIYGERLADLNYDYNEALSTREFQLDQAETLSTTDEQFEAKFEQERVKVLQTLDQATKEAEVLKAICDAARLDVEARRSNAVDPDEATLTESQFARQEEYQLPFQESTSLMPQAAFDNAETIEDPSSDHASDTLMEPLHESQGHERLNKWIEDLTA